MNDDRVHVGADRRRGVRGSAQQASLLPSDERGALQTDLLGGGFVASVVLAGVACALFWIEARSQERADAAPLVAALIAVALAAAHGWFGRPPRGAHGWHAPPIWRHRAVLLLLGCACAWLGHLWMRESTERALLASMFLVVLAGVGATAAAADRLSLVLWVAAVLALPMLAMFTVSGVETRGVGLFLSASGLVIVWLARRVHGLVARAGAVKRENDQLFAQLRNQVSLVEAAHSEKTRFLAAASHDLRQPMHALGLFAAALEKELRGTGHHPKIISMARAVDALEDSFGAMLDVSKLDAGIVQPNIQTFPIRDVFRRLHMHCAGQAELKGLSLRLKPGGKLVTSDPQLVERVLGNLVHNAIRYTQEGGVVVVVRSRGGRTSIEVWDTGVGIAAEELPNIFNEFYQVGNQGRDRAKGLGMGLAIVKRLVLLLGHELEVHSRPGKGTVFRLLMPATELAEMQSMVLGADTIPSAPDDDRTVLVIDDEEAVRAGMKELLESWGCVVLLAGTVAEARAVVRSHGGVIDIVVSDLRLADREDGLQAIAEVRAAYGAPLPAILITGDTSPDEVRRAHEGGHPVLFKPVRSRDLYAALRRTP